jgi:hypothetical protein
MSSFRGGLLARGKVSTDLLVNIFTALFAVPDAAFRAYIDRIKDIYDEGEEHVTEDYVMGKAELKSKVLEREGNYNMPTKEDEKIIALSAKLDKVKSQNAELSKQPASGKHTTNRSGGDDTPGGARKPQASTGKWAWKGVEPPTGSPHMKTVERNTYKWCPKHKACTLHLPSDCRLGEAIKTDEPNSTSPQINEALAAIAGEQGNIFQEK